MGVGADLYMCDVVKKFTFAISSPDEFLFLFSFYRPLQWSVCLTPRVLCCVDGCMGLSPDIIFE